MSNRHKDHRPEQIPLICKCGNQVSLWTPKRMDLAVFCTVCGEQAWPHPGQYTCEYERCTGEAVVTVRREGDTDFTAMLCELHVGNIADENLRPLRGIYPCPVCELPAVTLRHLSCTIT